MLRLLVLLCLVSSASAQSVVGPDVAESLARGPVRVVVALHVDDVAPRSAQALSALQARVADAQARTLAALPAGSFRVATAYTSVPALVLDLDTPQVLDILARLDAVARIDLDGGGGSGGLDRTVPLVQGTEWQTRGVTGTGITVAVLDTGIDTDHADFPGAVVDESCFANFGAGDGRCPNGTSRQTGPGAAEDDNDHGTHVAGIVASRGAGGSVGSSIGMAPGASLVVVKVLDDNNRFAAFSEIVAGMDYVLSNPQLGVRVLTMSLGTSALFPGVCDNSAAFTIAGAQAATALKAQGVSVFASSLNDGSNTSITAPACLSDVVAVGATNLSDEIPFFSNSNAEVEILAPGVGVVSSRRGGGVLSLTGTSMSSPHVAGCAALLLAGGAAATPDEVRDRILTASTVLVTDPGNNLTFPRLDCFDASFVAAEAPAPAASGVSLGAPSPNPARARTRVQLRAQTAVRVTLIDARGREVRTLHDGPASTTTLDVDVRALPPGVYAIRALSTQGASTVRVVVAR